MIERAEKNITLENIEKITKELNLTVFERTRIGEKHKDGLDAIKIAKLVKRDRSTIIRDLARNRAPQTKQYKAESAHAKALERREKRGVRPRLKNELIRKYTVEKLKLGWSPEQVSIRLPIDHKGQCISAEAIYQFVYAPAPRKKKGVVKEAREDLHVYLARCYHRREKKGFRDAQKLYRTVPPR